MPAIDLAEGGDNIVSDSQIALGWVCRGRSPARLAATLPPRPRRCGVRAGRRLPGSQADLGGWRRQRAVYAASWQGRGTGRRGRPAGRSPPVFCEGDEGGGGPDLNPTWAPLAVATAAHPVMSPNRSDIILPPSTVLRSYRAAALQKHIIHCSYGTLKNV